MGSTPQGHVRPGQLEWTSCGLAVRCFEIRPRKNHWIRRPVIVIRLRRNPRTNLVIPEKFFIRQEFGGAERE